MNWKLLFWNAEIWQIILSGFPWDSGINVKTQYIGKMDMSLEIASICKVNKNSVLQTKFWGFKKKEFVYLKQNMKEKWLATRTIIVH